MIEGYLPKQDRKNILLLCDDIRMHSGIATMAREFVIGTSHRYNWFNLGAAVDHPDKGKIIDISADVNKHALITDSDVKVMPNTGYGDAVILRELLKTFKFDAIFIFTDPRYWVWLFEIEREIRSKVPIFWLNIWDDYPAPMYNRDYYDSVDVLMSISKQTKNINELVLQEKVQGKLIEYVPHGINENTFFPIGKEHYLAADLLKFKESTLPVESEFTVFYNSRNIHRKRTADHILAFKIFCDKLTPDQAKKCSLIMHTETVSQHGTDLKSVKDAIYPDGNIFFSSSKINPNQMNMLYNIADVTMLLSSNEGWGLSLTESMMAGTMIIGNVTGGMQDQMRFVDEKGEWINFSADFPSNHRGTYKECGEWAIPVFPSNISLAGSPSTPYIFDDRCNPEDAAEALYKAYSLTKEERIEKGLKGREWVTSEESQMSASNMNKNIIRCIDKGFDNYKPRTKFDIVKIDNFKPIQIPHKLYGY